MSDFSAPTEVKCYWAPAAGAPLEPGKITRRAPTSRDVVIDVKYAGICHSDIHTFKVGERAGVGCMVDSCRSCKNCTAGEEQYCATGFIGTYGSRFRYSHCAEYNEQGGAVSYGGYSQRIVVDQDYTLHVPESIPYHTAAPLLCAGVTVYSPLKFYGLEPHHKYAVAGIGGLGHMAVKFGVAMGNHTTVISRGTAKRESALGELKAHAYLDSSNADEMKAHGGKFDFILSTIAAPHDINQILSLLTTNGKLIMVGVPPGKIPVAMHGFIGGRRTLAGSLIGGIRETQEMLDFCAQHNITSDVELIRADEINDAYERAIKGEGEVKYRFVIDTATL
eukprot:gene6958-5017_t